MMMGLFSETNITAQALILALEKLYDDYGLEVGDELVIRKKDGLGEVTKFEVLK